MAPLSDSGASRPALRETPPSPCEGSVWRVGARTSPRGPQRRSARVDRDECSFAQRSSAREPHRAGGRRPGGQLGNPLVSSARPDFDHRAAISLTPISVPVDMVVSSACSRSCQRSSTCSRPTLTGSRSSGPVVPRGLREDVGGRPGPFRQPPAGCCSERQPSLAQASALGRVVEPFGREWEIGRRLGAPPADCTYRLCSGLGWSGCPKSQSYVEFPYAGMPSASASMRARCSTFQARNTVLRVAHALCSPPPTASR